MRNRPTQESMRQWIKENKIQNEIDALEAIFKEDLELEYLQEVTLQSSMYSELRRIKRKGISNPTFYQTSINKLRNSLLELIEFAGLEGLENETSPENNAPRPRLSINHSGTGNIKGGDSYRGDHIKWNKYVGGQNEFTITNYNGGVTINPGISPPAISKEPAPKL